MEQPLTIFVWSRNRIVPVRLTDFSVTEEAFDPNLNPIRAKVSLGMRVLTVNDVGFDHRGGSLFMVYLKNKETMAQMHGNGLPGTAGHHKHPVGANYVDTGKQPLPGGGDGGHQAAGRAFSDLPAKAVPAHAGEFRHAAGDCGGRRATGWTCLRRATWETPNNSGEFAMPMARWTRTT